MKKFLTVLLCLCLVWTMIPLGVWAEPVVDDETGTITVTTLEELIEALNDEDGPKVVRVEQAHPIHISKTEDGFRTVIIPAGKTLWLENASCLQFQFARSNVRVDGGGGKLVVCDITGGKDITLFSGVPDEDAVFQVEEGWLMWCPNLAANDPEDPYKYTQNGEDKWIYITGNMWFEPGRVTVQGELPYSFAGSIVVDSGITMTVKEGKTFQPSMFAEVRGTLVIPEGSAYDIYYTQNEERIERRPRMTVGSDLICEGTLADYGCEVMVQNAGPDSANYGPLAGNRSVVAIDPGTKSGFSVESITLETSWTDKREEVSRIVPRWDPDYEMTNYNGEADEVVKKGAYIFDDPKCPLTATIHWRYDGGSGDGRSAELQVESDWDAPEPLTGEDYTINWYKKGADRPIATGDFVYNLDPGAEYEVEVLLNEEAAGQFEQIPRQEVSLDQSHNILSVFIPILETVSVAGQVTDPEGSGLSGASVTLRQINGQYAREETVTTEEDGTFSFAGPAFRIKSTLMVSIQGYFEECLSVENWEEYGGDPSGLSFVLAPLTTDRIQFTRLAVRTAETRLRTSSFSGGYTTKEEIPVVEELSGFPDYLEVSVYRKGEPPAEDQEIEVQADYPYLYLKSSVSPEEVLEVRIRDSRGLLTDFSGEVTLDENRTGSLAARLLEKGKLRVYVHRGDPRTEAAVMVFDEDGKLEASYGGRMSYSDRHDYVMSLQHIEAGEYTVVLMEKTRLLRAISSLSRLEEMGLGSGSDYILKNVTIRNGQPNDVEFERVPDTKIPSLAAEKQLSLTAGAGSVPVGNFVALRASYDLGENENGEQLRFDIPEGLTMVNNSVTVDGTPHPYSFSSGVLTVSTNKPRAVVRFGVIPSRAGTHTVNGYLNAGGGELMPMGSVTLESSMAEILAPAKTSKKEITVSGTAPYGCEVTVYDNGKPVGRADPKASGRWSAVIELTDAENTPIHRLTASFAYQGQPFSTDTAITLYNPDYMVVTTVTMINTAHTEDSGKPVEYVSVFDFEKDAPRPVYNYWPEFPTFTFEAAFSGSSSGLEAVNVITTDTTGTETTVEMSYNSASDTWVGTHDYETGYEIPSKLRVEYVDPKNQVEPYGSEDEYIDELNGIVDEMLRQLPDDAYENLVMGDYYGIEGGYGADILTRNGESAGTYRILQEETTLEAFMAAHETVETGESYDGRTIYKASEGDAGQWSMFYLIQDKDGKYVQITRSLAGAGEIRGEESGTVHGTLFGAVHAAAGRTLREASPGDAASNAVRVANQPGATIEDISAQLGGDFCAALENGKAEMKARSMEITDMEKTMMEFCANGGVSVFVATAMNQHPEKALDAAWDLGKAVIDAGLTDYIAEDWTSAGMDVIGFLECFVPNGVISKLIMFKNALKSTSAMEAGAEIIAGTAPADYSPWVGLTYNWGKLNAKLLHRFLDRWSNATPNQEIIGNQDPSGYVYEAVPSNRLEGVTATIVYRGENGEEIEWPQEIADQYNPQITNASGIFSWMVPQGNWRVKFSKEGYENTDSSEIAAKIAANLPGYMPGWLPVPPPQTEVNVPMVSTKAPDVASVHAYEDGIRIEFTQYMKPNTVEVTVTMGGEEVLGRLEPLNEEEDAAGENTYASVFRFVPAEGTELKDSVQVEIDQIAANYAAKLLTDGYSRQHDVEAAPTGIIAPDNVKVDLNDRQQITVTVQPAGAGKNKILTVTSSSPSVVKVTERVVTDSSGKATISLAGKLPGKVDVTVTLEGSDILKTIPVEVVTDGSGGTEPPGPGPGGDGGNDGPDTPTEPDDPVCPQDDSCPIYQFKDCDPKAWYHDGVHWALEEKIMNGTGDTAFEPNGVTTRAMIVTMLWRMEGQPSAVPSPFTDLEKGSWYEAAVNWAAEQEIVNGYSSEKFGPADPITREQLAAMLFRYKKGSAEAEPIGSQYTDREQISDWAMDAMTWAVSRGIINGMTQTTLAPRGDATRAQVATMLMRMETTD